MKLKSICWIALLASSLVAVPAHHAFAQNAASRPATQAVSPSTVQNNPNAPAAPVPLDKLVTATCRQAWHMGGRTQDGFFAIVTQLMDLAAQNRGVTLPDDATAGALAGEWIRTQALKDPDQLLYAIVDQAVQNSAHATSAAQSTTPTKK